MKKDILSSQTNANQDQAVNKAMAKKICMIVYSNYTRDARVRREAETLVAYGNKVLCLALAENASPRLQKINGVIIRELNVKKYQGKTKLLYIVSYIKFLVFSFLACTNLFFERRIDIVHVHNMPDFLVFPAILPRLFGKKLILDIHDSMPETYLGKFRESPGILYKFLCLEESLCCAFAHKVICVNHIQRDALVKRGIPLEKIALSLNAPDPNIFCLEGEKLNRGKADSSFNMVYHGTINDRLGIDLAIQAVERLLHKIPLLELHIWGDGESLTRCAELSRTLGTENPIHFHAPVPSDFLPEALKEMDLGIIPNRKDKATDLMLPVKLLEYVALGIPAVVPRLKTIQHYFSEDMVTYFDPENIDSMASAILLLYEDKTKRKQQAERARTFLDTYGWAKHKMALIKLYEDL